ncbi:MAG TPA: DUF4238 domain-containing protein [Stellaceae bacterium]|nr:DUF4238 domain-containing protein [Stellaceae bacterium]
MPKFLIRNFADADGRVFCLDIHTDKISKLPPKRAASGIDFNEFLIDGETISFENDLEKIETQAAPVLKQILRSCSVAGLTGEKRKRVARFMAAQSFRTEAFYRGMDLQVSREQFGHIFAQLWRSAFLVSDEVERRKWVVMTIKTDDVFYLGDNPVVLQRTENPSDGVGLGFDIEGVEAFLPLSPKCALWMPCTSTSEQLISGYENALSMHRQIRSAALTGSTLPGTNSDTLHLTQRVLRNAFDLYEALTKGIAINAISENIENLNYLESSWAHSAIYSNRGDFSFARRMFQKSPQYRESPRTSLGIANTPGTIAAYLGANWVPIDRVTGRRK